MNYIRGQCISLPTYGRNCWMTNCAGHRITGQRNNDPQCQNFLKIMATLTSTPIPTLTADELSDLVSSVNNDTLTWSTGNWAPGYGAVSTTGGGTGNWAPNSGYVYTSPNTVPWINTTTGTNPAMVVNQGGGIDIQGENADIKMNGKSMKAWMEKVEERLNILTPNPEMEKEWDDLRRLGERYRDLERKCKEKAQMWEALKKVQPKQP